MRSFRHEPDNRRQVYLNLVGSIEGQLRDAYAKRHEAGLETQSSLAQKLGINRSAVHHRLMGGTNMTLQTVADMIWALSSCIKVTISDAADEETNEHRIVPTHANSGVATQTNSVTMTRVPA